MKHLTTVLVLALASANASKYFPPEHRFQQVKEPKEIPYLGITFDEEPFLPVVEEAAGWESPPDPRMVLLNNLDFMEDILQEDPNDFRIKRTKTSLSIDNPLDVLRQQYFKALARRMKYKSIEKNREHLLKTGKRSGKEITFPINMVKHSESQLQNDSTGNGSGESSNRSNEQNPTTRRYQNSLYDLSYQT